jgi:uncharacterized damage-inducible protein DinB
MSATTAPSAGIIPISAFLAHWQGHRRLTRRVIELFPEDKLFAFSIDNEIHHRGQGYVYLRALGIEPPGFYDRE